VQFHEVAPGDLVNLPPGTVHALCRGVVIYEVQQSSDITFRLFDYNRLGLDGEPRELHVEPALAVIDFGAGPLQPKAAAGDEALVKSEHFELYGGRLTDSRALGGGDALAAVTLLAGEARLKGEDGTECRLRAGETALVPAGRQATAEAADGGAQYLLAVPGRG
jgi:mannose-6-phosphate isomerase